MYRSFVFLFCFGFLVVAKADVTVVQSVQAVHPGGGLEPAREMTIHLAGDKLRLDSGDISSIIRADKRMTYSILHVDKVFVAVPHHAGGYAREHATEVPAGEPEPVKARPTGKSDKVNGFNCAEVEVEQSDGTLLDTWVTQDSEAVKALDSIKAWQMGEYAPVLAGMGLQQRKLLPGMEGMPVRTTVLGPGRKPTVRVDIKQVSNSPIPAGLFEPPPGYREVSMEEVNSVAAPETSADLEKGLKELDSAGEAPRKFDAKH